MNKPSKREGFVSGAETVDDETGMARVAQQPQPQAAPAPQPEPEKEEWPVRVKLLHKPVRGPMGEALHELAFREPTGGDINRYGNPCLVDQNGEVMIIDRRMTTMIAVLSGVLQPFIEAMDPRDWNSCAYRLRGFFIPNPGAWL